MTKLSTRILKLLDSAINLHDKNKVLTLARFIA